MRRYVRLSAGPNPSVRQSGCSIARLGMESDVKLPMQDHADGPMCAPIALFSTGTLVAAGCLVRAKDASTYAWRRRRMSGLANLM